MFDYSFYILAAYGIAVLVLSVLCGHSLWAYDKARRLNNKRQKRQR